MTVEPPRLSALDGIVLAGIASGMFVGLALVVLGIVALAGAPAVTATASPAASAASEHAPSGAGGGAAEAPHVHVAARHVGKQVIEIRAQAADAADKPLPGAGLVAFVDMTAMPLAHRKGPLPLRAADGAPGEYELRTEVPMPGAYEVRVVMRTPQRAEASARVDVGVIDSGK